MKKRLSILLALLLLVTGINFDAFTVNAVSVKRVLYVRFMNDDDTVYNEQDIMAGQSIKEPGLPMKAGYVFVGWRAKEGHSAAEDRLLNFCENYDEVIDENGNMTNVDPIYVHKTVDGNGKTLPVTYTETSKFWGISGLYIKDVNAGGIDISAGTKKTRLTLTPVWEKEDVFYTVSFDARGGTPVPPNQKVIVGGKAKKPNIDPVKEGYTFLHWAYKTRPVLEPVFKENGTIEFIEKVQKKPNDKLTVIPQETIPSLVGLAKYDFDKPVNRNLNLIAVYRKNKIKVSFDAAGGSPEPPAQEIDYGAHPTKPVPDPSKESYTFKGWYHGDNLVDFATATPKEDVTYVAKYLPITEGDDPELTLKVKVRFDAMGGSPEPPTQEILAGGKATEPAPDPAKEGYVFKGWYGAEGKVDFTEIIIRDTTYYARYQKEGDDDTHDSSRRGDIDVPDKDYDKAIIPYSLRYISGYPDGTFRPANTITRAEMATIFTKLLELEYVEAQGPSPFSDTAGHWAEDYIIKIADYGLLAGYPDGTFRPEGKMKRAEIASIINKYWEVKGFVPNTEDANISDMHSHWAEKLVLALYNHNFVDLYEDGSFKPDEPLDRANVVQILNRITDRPLRPNEIQVFSDVPKQHWSFKEVGAAAR